MVKLREYASTKTSRELTCMGKRAKATLVLEGSGEGEWPHYLKIVLFEEGGFRFSSFKNNL